MSKGLKNSHIMILAVVAAIFIYFSISKEKYNNLNQPIFKNSLITQKLFESFDDIPNDQRILESFVITPDGRCGPKHNNTQCPGTQCCSKDGICGGEVGVKSEWCTSKKLNTRYSGWYSRYDGDGSK